MADFDQADIERRLAICEAATPGPWTFEVEAYSPAHVRADRVAPLLTVHGDSAQTDDTAAFIAHARTGYPAALRALQAAQEELRHARQVNTCDVCNGTGRPLSGGSCMCGGTGRMSDAALVLRADLVEARAEIERLRGFEAEAMAARRMLDVYDAAEMSYQCEACAALSTCKEWSIYAAARAANEQPPQGGEAATP